MDHRWMRVGASLTAAGAVAVAGFSLVDPVPATAVSKPLRIFMLVPSSTQYLKTNAQTQSLLARAAEKVVNRTGGAGHGHKVVLTVQDTGGSATTAVSKLEAALHSGTKPDVFINGGPSPQASAELPIIKSAHILMFNDAPTATSSNPSVNPTNFDESPSTKTYVQGFVSYTKAHHYTKVGIFHGNDAYGTTIGQAMTAGAKAAGLTVTDDVAFKNTGLTFTPTLQAIEATHPQVLWLDGYGAPPSYTLKDIHQLGWTLPMIADDSYSVSPTVVAPPPTGALGTTVEKNLKFETFAAGVYRPASKTPKNTATMIKTMKGLGSPKASLLFGYSYDAVVMAAYAARAANTVTTAAKLVKAVVKEEHKKAAPTGLFPTYGYTSKSHSAHVPASALAFTAPTKLVTGLFGTPTG